MSLAQLQAATAFLVRFPEAGRGADWDQFISRYELDPKEAAQLHAIAHNNQVIKYGKKLRRFRFVDAADALPAPESILGAALFEKLWFEHFEPIAAGIATENLTHDFLEFLCKNPVAIDVIAKEGPQHAPEFLNFIYLETSLAHQPDAWRNRPLPGGSVLLHGAICPLALNYDIPKLIQKESKDGYRKARRAPKPFYYVLLLKDGDQEPSLFAIDKSVYQFLKAQLEKPETSPERPAVYADLVSAGLCRK